MKAQEGPVGVLLMAYGGPDRLEDVEAYYTDVRGGRRPTPQQVRELEERYRAIGGSSPLLAITRRQAAALRQALGGGFRVYVGMRHWQPRMATALGQMAQDGLRRAVGLALAPHYSRMSVEAYVEAAERARRERGAGDLAVTYVRSWCRQPLFLDAVARRVGQALRRPGLEGAHVLFTAHSLPRRILEWDDPYPRELDETCRAVAERLGLSRDRWSFAFQSQGRTPEPWLGPGLEEALRELAGQDVGAVVVCPVGFVADHLEVLYDLDIEARRLAHELDLAFGRTDSLNDARDFVEALAAVVRQHLQEEVGGAEHPL